MWVDECFFDVATVVMVVMETVWGFVGICTVCGPVLQVDIRTSFSQPSGPIRNGKELMKSQKRGISPRLSRKSGVGSKQTKDFEWPDKV